MKVFGFAVDPKTFLVSHAIKEGDVITCYDLSGFAGNWKLQPEGVFFESISGEVLCSETCKKANEYCKNLRENKMRSHLKDGLCLACTTPEMKTVKFTCSPVCRNYK